MTLLNGLARIFLFPGTFALSNINISNEEDGGIFRSMINMIFWGIILVPIVLAIYL